MGSLVRVYDRLLGALAGAAATMLVGVVATICLDVILRATGIGRGIPGVIEFTEYALYGITLLGAAWALKLGAHVTVGIFVDGLPEPIRRGAWWLANAIGLVVSLILAYAGTLATWRSFEGARLVFRTYVFPEWWMLAPLPIGAIVLVIEFLRLMSRGPGRDAERNAPRPDGA